MILNREINGVEIIKINYGGQYRYNVTADALATGDGYRYTPQSAYLAYLYLLDLISRKECPKKTLKDLCWDRIAEKGLMRSQCIITANIKSLKEAEKLSVFLQSLETAQGLDPQETSEISQLQYQSLKEYPLK